MDVLPGLRISAPLGGDPSGELVLGTWSRPTIWAATVQDVLTRDPGAPLGHDDGGRPGKRAQELETLLGGVDGRWWGGSGRRWASYLVVNRTASELEGEKHGSLSRLARALARADSVMDRLNRTSGTLDESTGALAPSWVRDTGREGHWGSSRRTSRSTGT